jgi:hypothetical protein
MIQALLSVVIMVIGLAAMSTGPVGGVVFAVGGLWFLNTVRIMWGRRNASSINAFTDTLSSVPDLPTPKQITITAANPMMRDWLQVSLNGEQIGRVKAGSPFTFSVTKQKNIVSLPGGKKSACCFEVTEADGTGELEIRMGMTTPLVKAVDGCGIRAVG